MPFVTPADVQPDGRFEVGFDVEQLSLLFLDIDNKRCGFTTLDLDDHELEIAMLPTATYEGTLVDSSSKPLPGRMLRLRAASTDCDAATPQRTDDAGAFRFTAVASNVPLRLIVVGADPAVANDFILSGERLLMPGEARSGDRVEVRRRDELNKPQTKQVPLTERVAKLGRMARVAHMGALVALEGDASAAVTELTRSILDDDDETAVVLRYVTMTVDADQLKNEARAVADCGWPLPSAGEVMLIVLDGDRKLLANERFAAGDANQALRTAVELLTRHQPPKQDAVAALAKAKKVAAASDRRLWIVVGGPRCGPCFRLAEWMDEHREALEKDYVIVKIMGGLDANAREATGKLPRKEFSIPWYAIAEPDGTVLATSDGPLGNIGVPSTIEDIRHFRQMLERTARNLSSDEVQALAKSLAPRR